MVAFLGIKYLVSSDRLCTSDFFSEELLVVATFMKVCHKFVCVESECFVTELSKLGGVGELN